VNRSRLGRVIIVLVAAAIAFTPGLLDARFEGLELALSRAALLFVGIALAVPWQELSHTTVAIKRWQTVTLAVVATLVALVGAGLWALGALFCSDYAGCGPRQNVFLAIGLGTLAIAVIATWIAALRSRTGRTTLVFLVPVAVLSFYMIFGPPPQ
jgi:hypothetical protein